MKGEDKVNRGIKELKGSKGIKASEGTKGVKELKGSKDLKDSKALNLRGPKLVQLLASFIRETSSSLPEDAEKALRAAMRREAKGSPARTILETILANVALGKSLPESCQAAKLYIEKFLAGGEGRVGWVD